MSSLEHLLSIFHGYDSALLAYSGGIDSTLLLELLRTRVDARWRAVFVDHPALTEGERLAARAAIKDVQGQVLVATLTEMQPVWGGQRHDRCYHCKKYLFGKLVCLAKEMRLAVVIDGSHADDDPERRPGMRALAELGIESPLRRAGWGKALIRRQAREMGVESWNRPARACLAVGIDGLVTGGKLALMKKLENFFQQHAISPARFRLEANGRLDIAVTAADDQRVREMLSLSAFRQLLAESGVVQVGCSTLVGGATR